MEAQRRGGGQGRGAKGKGRRMGKGRGGRGKAGSGGGGNEEGLVELLQCSAHVTFADCHYSGLMGRLHGMLRAEGHKCRVLGHRGQRDRRVECK